MSAVIMVGLDANGVPEPGFCSSCRGFKDVVVWFRTYEMEVAVCTECITTMATAAIAAEQRLVDSRA